MSDRHTRKRNGTLWGFTRQQLEKGRQNSAIAGRLRMEMRQGFKTGDVDFVAVILGEVDDVAPNPDYEWATYYYLVKRLKAWRLVLWIPGVAETRGVQIFALADVPAGKRIIELRPTERQRLARAVDLLATPRGSRRDDW